MSTPIGQVSTLRIYYFISADLYGYIHKTEPLDFMNIFIQKIISAYDQTDMDQT